ncbi:hypothetical protein [Campylobacter troglodytis]
MSDEIEADESYFLLRFVLQLLAEGVKRVRSKRGCGAGKKTPVFLLR